MEAAAALALVLELAGCAGMYQVPASSPGALSVTWQRVDQVQLEAACPSAARTARARGLQLNACSREGWDELAGRQACTIYTRELVSAELLGHEALHCFGVDVHRE